MKDDGSFPSILEQIRRYFWYILLIPLLYWAADATQLDLYRLYVDAPKAENIITDLLQPVLFVRGDETASAYARIQVPCTSGEGPEQEESEGPKLTLSTDCANAGDEVTISGAGFRPNARGRIYWHPPESNGRLGGDRFTTDENGSFKMEAEIRPLLEEQGGESQVQAQVAWKSGSLRPSEALRTTTYAIVETVFLALMATTFGAIIAIPISFLGARNLMPRTPLGNTTYGIARTFLNTTRSIEPLILATIFAIWVGFGPYAGVLALTVSTVANIGKLYAEAAENISPGPLEALRSTGANGLQTVQYAVIPQIVPPYLSFTIYYWDINVRMSTIIGFVGGGGIGLELRRWIDTLQWNEAATAVWAIVVVVMTMDYVSAVVRERLI